jgi:hypothetical protein
MMQDPNRETQSPVDENNPASAELEERVSFEDIAKTVIESSIKGEDLVVEEICMKYGLEYYADKI